MKTRARPLTPESMMNRQMERNKRRGVPSGRHHKGRVMVLPTGIGEEWHVHYDRHTGYPVAPEGIRQ